MKQKSIIRIFVLAIALFSLVCLAACGNGQGEAVASESVQTTEIETPETTSEAETQSNPEIKQLQPHEFSDGLAWIEFEEDGEYYTGWINEDGDILYKTKGHCTVSRFENGYAHIKQDGFYYVISDSGKACSRYDTDAVISCGYGYTWVAETASGFDSVSTTYTLFDPYGKEIDSFEREQSASFSGFDYKREGVFAFYETRNGYRIGNFYSAKNQKWAESQLIFDIPWPSEAYYSRDGFFVFFAGHADNDVDIISYLDRNGSVVDIDIPEEFGRSPVICGLSNGFLLLYNNNDNQSFYYTVDLENQEFKKLTGEYAEKINWYNNGGSILKNPDHYGASLRDGITAIALIGADGNPYFQLFDTDWNLIGDPIRANNMAVADKNTLIISNYAYKDDVLIYASGDAQKSSLYHADGTEIPNTEYEVIECVNHIFLARAANGTIVYLNADGEKLFDSLNASTAKEIDFSAVQ